MASKRRSWWIKQRDNPQTGTYYVAYGQLSAKDARAKEYTLYGSNTMLRFESEKEYSAKLAELARSGTRVLRGA